MPHPKSGYRLKDKTRVPGTTTIIGRFKDSAALLWWAFAQGQAYERGEITGLYDKRDQAADSGTLAHLMVERHINGQKPEDVLINAPESVKEQATNAFLSYLSWEEQSRLKITLQEIELVSEEYRFGGCPDAVGEINGQLVLIDWKTSNGIYQDYLIQLAAYKQLWEENNPLHPITGGFHLCRFAKENGDFAHYYWPELNDAWESFKLMRKLYDLDKILKKRT